ncbi:MAG: hypothetical protein R3B68_11515 [Phycisphaerales bacterium]
MPEHDIAAAIASALHGMNAITGGPPPNPLPAAPLLDRLLFEQPLLLSVPLGAGALVALFVFNARAQLKRGLLVALALAALAGLVWLASTLVETKRDAVRSNTRDLVNAIGRADTQRAGELLSDDPEIRYGVFRVPSRAALLVAIREAMGPGGRYELQSWRIAELQATIDGPSLARTQVLVRATEKSTGAPGSLWAVMQWEQDEQGRWRCFVVEPLNLN